MNYQEIEFTECIICSKKPGSPDLCPSCLLNRTAILRLKTRIEYLDLALQGIKDILKQVDQS